MSARVTYVENPFAPAQRRSRLVRRGARLSRLAPRTNLPVIALVNGKPVLRAHRGWQRRRLVAGDDVTFVCLPLGGGGGGSNPLRIVLQIALFALAGPLATMMTGATSGIMFGLAQAGILMAGSAIIGALIPVSQGNSMASLPQASPTYSLTAQGNQARLGLPIPVQYGRLKFYPDLAAQPYTEFANEDQYLYQLLCLGVGDYSVEAISIEDTPISSFAEVETQLVGPGQAVTLFPTAVDTSVEVAGQELTGARDGTYVRSGSTVTITFADHGITSGQTVSIEWDGGAYEPLRYEVVSVPGPNSFVVTQDAIGTSGSARFRPVQGGQRGFFVGQMGAPAHSVAVDVLLPLGLYNLDPSTGAITPRTVSVRFQARPIDDAGLPLAAWSFIGTETITGASATPRRQTFRYQFASPGRYAVRAWRVSLATTDTQNAPDTVLWGGLRAYSAEPVDRGPVTLLAVRMRATGNLSAQASRRIAVLAHRKISTWSGSAWGAVAIDSSPWAIADIARDMAYGGALPDERIDLVAIAALAATAAARGDRFDYRFDTSGSWWDAVQTVAGAFRARCFMQGGVLRVVRDEARDAPVAVFSQRNIIRDSLSIDYLPPTDDTADSVKASYFDGQIWSDRIVSVAIPGSTSAKPVKIELPGITSRAQATREAAYRAATNRWRRKFPSFETEMDGFIPSVGDLIGIQHDMPGWGQSAEIAAWAEPWLTLDQDVSVTAGESVVAFRRPDGSMSGPHAVTAVSARRVRLATSPDFAPEVRGQDRERTHLLIGTVSTYQTRAKVIRAVPTALDRVRIEAVVDEPAVYAADIDVAVPAVVTSSLARSPVRPVISGLFARRWPDSTTRIVLGWRPAVGATSYSVEMAAGDEFDDPDAQWTRVADVSASQVAVDILHALRTMIRVRGVGSAAGDWVGGTIGTLIPDFWLSEEDDFWADADSDPFWS